MTGSVTPGGEAEERAGEEGARYSSDDALPTFTSFSARLEKECESGASRMLRKREVGTPSVLSLVLASF